ncbi:MAG: TM1266 family iron-only hydrogenase system putative regulator [Roseburia faecis]
MDTRVAVISIIVEDSDSIETLNQLLYDARDHIIGRMGIPYREKGISIVSIAIVASRRYLSVLFRKSWTSERSVHSRPHIAA